MSRVQTSRVGPAGSPSTGQGRLRHALLRFPRVLFRSQNSAHGGDLREAPQDLAVVTMLEALELVGTERVLEIGSPTAYVVALLSQLATRVHSVVPDQELAARREQEMAELGCHNVQVVHAEAHEGWPIAAPYAAILVGAAAPHVPLKLVHQLEVGGRMVIAIGDKTAQLLACLHKRLQALDGETLGACRLPMLSEFAGSTSVVPWTPRAQAQ